MSWSKYAVGESKTAQAQVEKFETPTHLRGDELAIYEAGRELIISALDALSPNVIAEVTFMGHFDDQGNGGLKIEVKQVCNLSQEPAEPSLDVPTYP